MNSLKTQYPRISFFSPIASVLCLVTQTFQMYKRNLEKVEEPEIKLTTFLASQKKQGDSKKKSTSASLTELKPLTVWITTNHGNFFKRWEYQTTLPFSWETSSQVKKQQLELDTEQWMGVKLGKEYVKAVYCHPAYLTYMQNMSCEMLGWMNHKLESRLPWEILTTSDGNTLMAESEEELKSLLMKARRQKKLV